jgi:acyl carrier protein
MSDAAIRERIRVAVGQLAPVAGPVDPSTSLTVDLGFDSLGLIELAVYLEQELELPAAAEDDLAGVETVADVEALVLGLLVPDRPDAQPTPGGPK